MPAFSAGPFIRTESTIEGLMPLRFQPGVVVGALLFAFAGARGVSKVEARIDQGPWQQAHEADGLRKDGFTRSGRLDSLEISWTPHCPPRLKRPSSGIRWSVTNAETGSAR